MISIYEKTGMSGFSAIIFQTSHPNSRHRYVLNRAAGLLKKFMPQIHRSIIQKFCFYFGPDHPGLSITAPHAETIESPSTGALAHTTERDLRVLFVAAEDGRGSIVDLTRTLTEMSQKSKIHPADIGTDLIDAELSDAFLPEPDLLILFGPYVELEGYPPWQIRLTEIFCLQDNRGVGYQVFLRGLRNFAKAQMRRGK